MEFNYKNIIKAKNKSIKNILNICEEKDKEIERLTNELDREKSKVKEYGTRMLKAIEVIDLIKPELWNISNKMTYRLLDIKNILLGDNKE